MTFMPLSQCVLLSIEKTKPWSIVWIISGELLRVDTYGVNSSRASVEILA